MNDLKKTLLWLTCILAGAGSLLVVEIDFCATPALAQEYLYGFDQSDDHGLTDTSGKELLPPIYAGIKYLGHGLFLLKQKGPEQSKHSDCAKEKLLFNNSFNKVQTSVPPGTTFERILWLGSSAQEKQDFIANEVPSDALIVIEPKYAFAREFHNGRAFVRFPAADKPAHNELIDKLGRLASAAGLKAIASYGSYIEVEDASGNLGVVNQKFESVIQPKYKSISAQLTTPPTVDEYSAWYEGFAEPIYYFATAKDDGRPVILSQKGETISTAPSELVWKGAKAPPALVDEIYSFDIGSPLLLAAGAAANKNYDVAYRQIAPCVLLKTVCCDRKPRRNLSSANFKNFPTMVRTLHYYICEPLIPCVDAFTEGRYEEAIKQIQNTVLDERKSPAYQPVYMRALCLQALGEFEKAKFEYTRIIEGSNDLLLKERAQTGLDSCSHKQSAIPSSMLTFPPRWKNREYVNDSF
ncbi:hypothetical protein BH11CYA1_BH11CYA1_18340 [soil metagenome]